MEGLRICVEISRDHNILEQNGRFQAGQHFVHQRDKVANLGGLLFELPGLDRHGGDHGLTVELLRVKTLECHLRAFLKIIPD